MWGYWIADFLVWVLTLYTSFQVIIKSKFSNDASNNFRLISPTKYKSSVYNLIKTLFLAVFIAPVCTTVILTLWSLYIHLMLILVLFDVQYLHNDVFSFEKGFICQSHLPPNNLIIQQNFLCPPSLFGKRWTILGWLLFHYMLIMIKLKKKQPNSLDF